MGCGASTQAAVREQVAAAVETAKAKATEAVANSKYYAIGCKFDPDAVSQEKSLGQLEKALKAARAGYGKWAKSFVPLSSALITHWAETTEMPQAGKDELKVVAASISRAAGEHKKFADAVLAELCVKGEVVSTDPIRRFLVQNISCPCDNSLTDCRPFTRIHTRHPRPRARHFATKR